MSDILQAISAIIGTIRSILWLAAKLKEWSERRSKPKSKANRRRRSGREQPRPPRSRSVSRRRRPRRTA